MSELPTPDQENPLSPVLDDAANDLNDTTINMHDHSPDNSIVDDSRPDGLPDKFWDPTQGRIRTEALVKSYLSLEKMLGGTARLDIPNSADDYSIEAPSDLIHPDAELNSRLHEAGFSQNQAQLVYDLAEEHLSPLISEMSAELEAQHQIAQLTEEFGGEENWQQISRQISTWGQANFPEEQFQALASSVEGVRSLYQMMAREEPDMVASGNLPSTVRSEQSLKALMRDPRYWRDQNPAIVAEVREGFQRLYPEGE